MKSYYPQRSAGRCLSFCSEGSSCDYYPSWIRPNSIGPNHSHGPGPPNMESHCAGAPLALPPPPDIKSHCTRTPALSDIWWPLLETCSDLFTSGPPLVLTSSGYWSMYGLRKQAVRILLECFLVNHALDTCDRGITGSIPDLGETETRFFVGVISVQ